MAEKKCFTMEEVGEAMERADSILTRKDNRILSSLARYGEERARKDLITLTTQILKNPELLRVDPEALESIKWAL